MTANSPQQNPYAPPASLVDDVGGPDPSERPKSVIYAVRLLWAAFGIGVLSSIADLLAPDPELPSAGLGITVTWTLVGFGISYWLYTAAWRGRGWSRIVLAVLLALTYGFLFVAWSIMPVAFDLPIFAQIETVVLGLMNIVGTVLLFAPSANAWYRALKAARTGS